MTLKWNRDTIRWYIDANEHTGFYRNIAEDITPMLSGYKSLCDMGCGLGLIDLELYRIMERIDCIDINDVVIETLDAAIKERNINNIFTRVADCSDISENWDVIYMSFFGSRELHRYLPYCKKLIAIVGKKASTEIFPSKYRTMSKNTTENVEQYLSEKGIEYSLMHREYEFGQPFHSTDEARSFIKSLSEELSMQEIDKFLDERLIDISHPIYKYFMPRKKPVGIFELKGML